ncbi:MAG TPA: BamA/TamA family outer membrane protein, partial [Saprospiraceae bacterium]|nr:BamA/TamA family outer membrane protein [Saprospiraceae bacterium]
GFFLYLPNTTSEFDTLLATNPFLEKSFKGRRLFTSFFMDNLTFYYQSKIKNKFQHAFIHNLNFSGIEVQTLNFLYNKVSGNRDTFSIGDFEFSKFARAEMDYRIYYTHSERSRLAARIAIGAVSPFGSSNSVPYIKQFYVGGPQSLRGWNIRELGPGNLNLSSSVKDRQTYYAAGDVKIEGNIEYRFDIIWRLKGAFFVDAGNIWLLPRSENRGQPGFLSSNLLNEIAIGTGMGLRVDLSYFLFRVDIGFKLRNPYKGENGSNWIYSSSNPVSVKNLFKNSTLHLALDYPF